jgi:hypothetical protein
MTPIFEIEDEATARHEAEMRVPTPGTWIGLGAGILVVVAGFVWTIL